MYCLTCEVEVRCDRCGRRICTHTELGCLFLKHYIFDITTEYEAIVCGDCVDAEQRRKEYLEKNGT